MPAAPAAPAAPAPVALFADNPRLRRIMEELFGIDLRTLALFRAGLALMLLGDLVWRLRDLEAFYTDFGVLPRDRLPFTWNSAGYVCPHAWGGGAAWQGFLFALAAAFAVMLLLGYKTRLATVASWALLVSLHNRNPMVLQGGDVLLRMLAFWAMFLPLGARYSLDARRFAPPAPSPADPEAGLPEAPPRAFSAGTVAALLQVAYVYWFTVALKKDPAWLRDGTAVWLALHADQFATSFGIWMRDTFHPLLLRLSSYATVALEEFGPSLAFFPLNNGPLRTGVVFALWAFHLVALNLTLRLGHFPWVCAVAWILFLPSWFWDVLAPRMWARGARPSAARRGVEEAWARLKARTSPAPGADPPRLRPPVRLGLPRAMNAVVALLFLYVTLWNLRGLDPNRFGKVFPQGLNVVADKTRIDQSWAMFAPKPLTDDGWFVFRATLRDGSRLDLYREYMVGGAPVFAPGEDIGWEKPGLVSATFRGERWRKYLMNLWSRRNSGKRPWFADYLRRRWDRDHADAPGKQISRIEICYMKEMTPLRFGGTPGTPRRVTLYQKMWALPLAGLAEPDIDPLLDLEEEGGAGVRPPLPSDPNRIEP